MYTVSLLSIIAFTSSPFKKAAKRVSCPATLRSFLDGSCALEVKKKRKHNGVDVTTVAMGLHISCRCFKSTCDTSLLRQGPLRFGLREEKRARKEKLKQGVFQLIAFWPPTVRTFSRTNIFSPLEWTRRRLPPPRSLEKRAPRYQNGLHHRTLG